MKAVQIVAPGELRLAELPSRPLRAHEARIAVASSCVCGSDLKNIREPVLIPQTPGHEFSGAVIETSGEARDSLCVGDRVTAFPMMACWDCADCRAGRLRDCARKLSLGFQLPGSFAEEVIVDSRLVVPLDEGLSYEQGALVEHLCCGYRLAKELSGRRLSADPHVVLIGDGPIALADLQSLRLLDYRRITLVGKHPRRMDLARRLGAAPVLDRTEVDRAMKDGVLPPADVIIMAAPAEKTLGQLLPLLRPRGLVFPQARIKDPALLSRLTETGVELGRAFAYELGDFGEVMALIKDGSLGTDSLVTERVDLLEFARIFPGLDKGSPSKTGITNHRFGDIVATYRKAAS